TLSLPSFPTRRSSDLAAFFPPQLPPAKPLLRGDLLEQLAHVELRRERSEERLGARLAGSPIDVLVEQDRGRSAQCLEVDEACVRSEEHTSELQSRGHL